MWIYYAANAELVTNNGEGALHDLTRYAADPARWLAARGTHHSALREGVAWPAPVHRRYCGKGAADPRNRITTCCLSPMAISPWHRLLKLTGFPRQAALAYQRVYFSYPAAELAEKSPRGAGKFARLARLRLSKSAATGSQQLDRANAWLSAKTICEGPPGIRRPRGRAHRTGSR